ncbi:uncharacterized protein LOC110178382 [Drosophila serrata]|uniref:uncharacterized protein LOC110178382 n=1 Tax=Drosophila serrata TaxID=7274 RepID=UPI000A1CFA9F|nr:uncharacterized protein LOC110178382 [Drosophila serrata]
MILLLIQLIHYTETKRQLRWECFDCKIGPQFGDKMKCQVGGTRNSVLNVEVNLREELDAIKTYVKISTKFKITSPYRKFFDITFDGCRVITDMVQGTMVSNMFKAIVRSSNQPRKCPIKKGLIYYHNISLEEVLPMFVPNSYLFVEVGLFSKRQSYLNVTLRGEVSEK